MFKPRPVILMPRPTTKEQLITAAIWTGYTAVYALLLLGIPAVLEARETKAWKNDNVDQHFDSAVKD